MAALALLSRAAAEALFYALTAGWYLLCVQWDVVDVLLGGPDLNKVRLQHISAGRVCRKPGHMLCAGCVGGLPSACC